MTTSTIPVIVVGAGPTGVTAATLLGQYGIETLVLDRWDSVYPQPRAVHADDETFRLVARLGLGAEFAAAARPSRGLRLVDAKHRVLAEFARSSELGPHGYPEANMFDQPELEALLRANLAEQATVTLRGNVEVTGITQHGGQVAVHLVDRITGVSETVCGAYVLGCDGANSGIRTAIGASMRDLGFTQRWLVVDADTDADLAQWEGVHQVCDPVRAATYMRIGKRRYRWEFQLLPGETAEHYRDPDRLRVLLAPWTGSTPIGELEIVRAAEYTFRAQIADRWRDRRVFLLGDAAHLSPPFIGQGMCAGLRDAGNLAWKLAAVVDGTLPESVLDTYQAEREPHVHALIGLARLIGTAMTAGGRVGNLLRRVLIPPLHLLAGVSRRILSSATPPLRRSNLVVASRLHRGPAGTLVPNAPLGDGRRLDELTGGRFALIARTAPVPALRAALHRHAGVVVIPQPDTELHRWLTGHRVTAAIARPDGTVLAAGRDQHRLAAVLTALTVNSAPAQTLPED